MRGAPGPLRTAGYARGELCGARVDHSRPLSSGRGSGVALTPGVVSVLYSCGRTRDPAWQLRAFFPAPRDWSADARPPRASSLSLLSAFVYSETRMVYPF